MADEKYFWIECSEDGPILETLTKKELKAKLKEKAAYDEDLYFETELPRETDTGVWVTIIKGRIIQPTPVEKVTEFEVP